LNKVTYEPSKILIIWIVPKENIGINEKEE
jgi:hypothetical protein